MLLEHFFCLKRLLAAEFKRDKENKYFLTDYLGGVKTRKISSPAPY
jgi:hypothetical protein